MAKQILRLKQKRILYKDQVNPNANISRILMLILTLFVLFMLIFFKTALRIENTLISIANNTSNANNLKVENIYNNYYTSGNASVAVYVSLSASEIYYLTMSLSRGNKTLESIKINNYGNNIYPQNRSISSTQIPVFIPSRQYVVIFSGLKAFSEYNISISGTVRPYCTKICPMASAGSANSLDVNAIPTIGIGGAALNVSSSSFPSSSLSVNSFGTYPVHDNASNKTSTGALPSFIMYVHTYKTVLTGANNTVVNITFSVV